MMWFGWFLVLLGLGYDSLTLILLGAILIILEN